ncbi:hypothetical protein BU594_07215 [Staphylococcus arlettae]|nr:hypothetical protein BU594_07215 [Staphylococcus arlettae]
MVLLIYKTFDFDRACLPGVWFEPIVSHAYYFPGRQHDSKSGQFIFFYSKKVNSYELINITKINKRCTLCIKIFAVHNLNYQ